MIKRYVQEVYLTYDSDDAGTRAALRAVPILKEAGISAKVIRMDPYKIRTNLLKILARRNLKIVSKMQETGLCSVLKY